MSAALMLARDGHKVTLVERDSFVVGAPEDSPQWPRKGVPHFLQPHAFIPRGRRELIENLPDIYATLVSAGARDVDGRAKLPGEIRPEDADLQFMAVRRPLIEWALRRAVDEDPTIRVEANVQVTGLSVENEQVSAVHTDGSELACDLVVDALGRRSRTADWVAEATGNAQTDIDATESSDCGVVYYSRYYRIRPGFELPDGPWVLGPRGDLGYMGFATFPGDNGTFAVTLSVPTGFPEWHVLKDAAPFEACVSRIPALRLWVDPEGVEPLTDVMAMAGLNNTIRRCETISPIGLIPIGDAYCHTDPVVAYGLSFGLMHAVGLSQALRDHDDLGDACSAYAEATFPVLRERYDLSSALDDQRHRMWSGEPVDPTRRDGAYALFTLVAGGAVSAVDPEVFRLNARRTGLLDSTSVLDSNIDMQKHIEQVFHQMLETPRPPPGPTRDAMLEAANNTSELPEPGLSSSVRR